MALVFGDCVVEISNSDKLILKRRYFDEEWYFVSINGSEEDFKTQISKLGVKTEEFEMRKSGSSVSVLPYFNALKSGNYTAIVKINK
jgi:hypothetical protein